MATGGEQEMETGDGDVGEGRGGEEGMVAVRVSRPLALQHCRPGK